jgi:HAD superfamily hydrolase (TIGR01549 family)
LTDSIALSGRRINQACLILLFTEATVPFTPVQLTGNLGVEGKLRLCGWGTGMAGISWSVTGSAIAVVDIDGTLIDSNYQHALAWYRALRSVGETYPVWRLHRLIGMGGDQVLTAVGGEELERRVGDQAREQQGKEVDALLEEMAPLPGARDLLVAIKERGHRLVLASSGQQRHVEVFLDKLDARDIADDWTTSADVEVSKPAPDLLQVALNKLGAPSEASSVMVGDSVWDVEAAKKAGMPAIVVRSGGFGDDELQEAGAIAIYDTPGDLATALDDTPLA